MKTFFTNLLKVIISIPGIIAMVAVFILFLVSWGIVVNFTYDNQWIVLIPDVTCVWLLSLAIRRNAQTNSRNKKNKFIMISFVLNVAILLLASFGAAWNFLIMAFLILPLSIYFSGKFKHLVS